jgi:heme exporter protein B
MRAFFGLLRRDIRLSLRQGGDLGLVLGFFVLTVLLFPFGVGPEPQVLGRIAAGIIWAAALLAAVVSLDRLFAADFADGGLDLIALSPLPLELAVVAKVAAHWLTTSLPLVLISPLLAVFVDLDPAAIPLLILSLLIGTPALSLLGAIAAALTLGARCAGLLVALVVAADLRHGRDRGSADRRERPRRFAVARRDNGGGIAAGAVGDGCGAATIPRIGATCARADGRRSLG